MNPSIDSSMKKHLVALLYVVVIVLLFVKWLSFWGYKFGLIGLYNYLHEPIFLVALIISGLSCLYSLIRSETGGRKLELPIGFVITTVFVVYIMIIVNDGNKDLGILGPQLTAAPTAEIILCTLGVALCFMVGSDGIGSSGSRFKENSVGIKKTSFKTASSKECSTPSEGSVEDDPTPSIAQDKCSYCGSYIPNHSAFCPSCGKSTIAHRQEMNSISKRICPSCKANVDSDSAFCPFCGSSMDGLKNNQKRKRIEKKESSFTTQADRDSTFSLSPENERENTRGFSHPDEFD